MHCHAAREAFHAAVAQNKTKWIFFLNMYLKPLFLITVTPGLLEDNHQPLNASNLECCIAAHTVAVSAARTKQYPMCAG